MAVTIRKAAAGDAPAWLELLKASFGTEFPDKQVYDPSWLVEQLQPEGPTETWLAEENGKLLTTISFLPPSLQNSNPVANVGRHLVSPDSLNNGAAAALLARVNSLSEERKQVIVARVFASHHPLQMLYETSGFSVVGFQPFKHLNAVREGTLFYYRMGRHDFTQRLPISDSFPQISELASAVLAQFSLQQPAPTRDGVTGYPLQSELKFQEGTADDYDLWKMQAQSVNPPVEISGSYNQGFGYFRTLGESAGKAILALRDGQVVAGVLYVCDPVDKCARLVDAFSQDDLSMGPTLAYAVKFTQQAHNVVYVEMDVLTTAPRLLKTAEQLGFVPVAYLPGIFSRGGQYADVVKLMKLNIVYSLEAPALTAAAKRIVEIIDHQFQDQKMGVAIINLLRGLPFFDGLGDGELRKISRLFTQKLYRPGEKIFAKGDTGNEAYVVMRGQVDIILEEGGKPIAQIGNGQIFGELAFLDSTPRTAAAVAAQPSILLVMQRSGFNILVEREPHLGMVVMRNVAIELSNRLRKANAALAGRK